MFAIMLKVLEYEKASTFCLDFMHLNAFKSTEVEKNQHFSFTLSSDDCKRNTPILADFMLFSVLFNVFLGNFVYLGVPKSSIFCDVK